jgi:hypothetical protein
MKNDFDDFSDEPRNPYELTEMWMDDMILPTERFLQEEYWDTWKKWLRLDIGDQWDMYAIEDLKYASSDNPRTKITVNMIGPPIRQLRAYATARRSYISCKATHPQAHIAAVLAEKGINYEWRRNKFHREVKKVFLEAAIVGFCWAETGWTTVVDEREKPEPNERMDFRDYIRKDSGYLRKLDCFKVGYDLRAPSRSPDTARFIYESFNQEPWYVVNNKYYHKEVRADIRAGKEKPEVIHETSNQNGGNNKPYSDKKMYCLYRVWDKMFKRMYIFCKGVKRPLVAQDWPWDYLDEFPIKMLPFIPAPYDYFPVGFPQWVEDLQYERNRTRTAMFHYRRTNTGGQIYITDALKSQSDKLLRGDKVIVGPDDSQPPVPIPNAPLPPEQFAIDGLIEIDAQKIMGLPAWAQGGTSKGRRSATETMRSSEMMGLRIDDIIEELDVFIEAVASDQIKHMQANYTTERLAELSGPLAEYWGRVTGQPAGPDGKYWVPYTKEHIQGEFDLEIESTVKPKSDPGTELQNITIFMQACERVAPMGSLAMPTGGQWSGTYNGINFFEILRKMADRLGIKDAAHIISQLAVVPPPVMEQTALQAQQQQQAQPIAPENQVFEQAATPQSAVAGQFAGLFNGQPQ